MLDMGFLGITLALIAVVLGSVTVWLRARRLHKNMSKIYYLVPIIIIMVIIVILTQKTLWDIESISLRYDRQKEQILTRKWGVVEMQLAQLQEENYALAGSMANQIIEDLSRYDAAVLDINLGSLPSENNIVQIATDDALRGVYFRNISNDANDPLALIVGKGPQDSFIFSDFSQNCALDASEDATHSMEQEYALVEKHGDRSLAEYTFSKVLALDQGLPLQNTLFNQFESREIPVPAPYKLTSLKSLFFELKGDVAKTFESLEIYAPHYIYRDQAISGSPRVVDRIKTDAKAIAVVSIFNYVDVVANDPVLYMQLDQLDKELTLARYERILEERSTLIIGLLIMFAIFALLILFWVFMHFNGDDGSR